MTLKILLFNLAIVAALVYSKLTGNVHDSPNHDEDHLKRKVLIKNEAKIHSILASPSVEGYQSCLDLKQDIINASMHIAKYAIKLNLDLGETDGTGPLHMHASNPFEPSIAEDIVRSKSSSSSNQQNSFKTNNQVEGIDEVDEVKSDGDLIYLIHGNEVLVLSNKNKGQILSRVTVPKVTTLIPEVDIWPFEKKYKPSMPSNFYETDKYRGLLLNNGKLVVIVTAFQYATQYPRIIAPEKTAAFIYNIQEETAELTLVDTKIVRGSFVSARTINGKAYITSSTDVDIHALTTQLERRNEIFWHMTNKEYEYAALQLAEEITPLFSEQLLAEIYGDKDNGLYNKNACEYTAKLSLAHLNSTNDIDTAQFFTMNLLRSFAQVKSFHLHTSSLFSQSSNMGGAFLPSSAIDVFVNKDIIILGSRGFDQVQNSSNWIEQTYFVAFDIVHGNVLPSASGKVQGYILNSFSIDYHDNYLRVATTTNAQWGVIDDKTKEEGVVIPATNQVYILQKQDDNLQIVGKVNNLGITEHIKSVRFLGDKAFVVSFKTEDPLYAIDLSQPNTPEVVGELKVSGFSNYLHPIGDSYLVGVGQETDENGKQLGFKVSLFDITNMSQPTLVNKIVLEGNSYSNVQYDHHAFRYLPQSQILIVPVSVYPSSSLGGIDLFDGFLTYYIDTKYGIQKLNEVVHANQELVSFYKCFSDEYLNPHSMVFSSQLITFKGHTVINSGDLLALEGRYEWVTNLDADYKKSCFNWFPWL